MNVWRRECAVKCLSGSSRPIRFYMLRYESDSDSFFQLVFAVWKLKNAKEVSGYFDKYSTLYSANGNSRSIVQCT